MMKLKISVLIVIVILVCYYFGFMNMVSRSFQRTDLQRSGVDEYGGCASTDRNHLMQQRCRYDNTYPLTRVLKTADGGQKFKIAMVADLDEERSKVPNKKNTWQSYLKFGYLSRNRNGVYSLSWHRVVTLYSNMNENGRGLELSDLCVFNGKVYTIDDRTGLVYQILNEKVIPWVILNDGPGLIQKGFKSEWMTVKDGALYIGGLGKEWTSKEGQMINYHPMFVKSIDPRGSISHHNWTDNYIKVRANVDVHWPGYMVHEAVVWSSVRRRWYFLPRRMSQLKYNDILDERRGTNVLIHCDDFFYSCDHIYIGKVEPTHGFSSLKFLPGSQDMIIVALKSMEVESVIRSFIMVFKIDGTILLDETLVGDQKFEGVEFV